MFKFKATVRGLEGIFAELRGVDAKVRKKILRKAVGEASKIVLRDAKSRVPVATGQLRKSLGRRVKTYRGSGVVVVLVGPRTGFKTQVGDKTVNPTQYAHLVEKGTRAVQARPFLRPALDNNEGVIRAKIAEVVAEGIANAAS